MTAALFTACPRSGRSTLPDPRDETYSSSRSRYRKAIREHERVRKAHSNRSTAFSPEGYGDVAVPPDVVSPDVVPVDVEPLVAVGSVEADGSDVVTVEVDPLDVVGSVEVDGASVVADGDSTAVVGVGSGALLIGDET